MASAKDQFTTEYLEIKSDSGARSADQVLCRYYSCSFGNIVGICKCLPGSVFYENWKYTNKYMEINYYEQYLQDAINESLFLCDTQRKMSMEAIAS